MDYSRHPIVLCHAACTGGSLIYRLLILAFRFIGVSELSHISRVSSRNFLPSDPEAQFHTQGIITTEQFSDIFFNRIVHCNELSIAAGKTLLIREHSHSYFFSKKSISDINNISWINSKYQQFYGESLFCLLSVRDPIDSWLGLRHSFPKEKLDFDTYCEKYLTFIDMIEKTKHIYIFKYEDIIQDVKGMLINISAKIDCKLYDIYEKQNNIIASSGNSGRQGTQITLRPRRPYTTRLIDAANNSKSYQELCYRLGYPCLNNPVKLKEQVVVLKNTLRNNFIYYPCIYLEKIGIRYSRNNLIRD